MIPVIIVIHGASECMILQNTDIHREGKDSLGRLVITMGDGDGVGLRSTGGTVTFTIEVMLKPMIAESC